MPELLRTVHPGPDPLPHLRRETPGVQAAQQGQAAGHSLGHSSDHENIAKLGGPTDGNGLRQN